ncbi:hypothetical protein [Streptomyces fructofermentans]|uniref:DUF4388 domain-containing protein n=1 Tax=Streptomyces fructofermentans TaxID=152141 RepID=A0A918K1R7_9ACTN|nr:hypothetical protein [Streptomyces fructofermentans]GGX39906.1 hypothetical protein GCM10010515_03100 [Streptomyces fructofermentans]
MSGSRISLDRAGYGLLSRTLAECGQGAVTGVLQVSGKPGGVFHLRDGFVVAAESPGSPGPEALLLRSGRISEEQWDALLFEAGAGRWPQAGLVAHEYAGAAQLRVICMQALQDAVFAVVAGRVDGCEPLAAWADPPASVAVGEAPLRLLQEATRKLTAVAGLPCPVLPDRERPYPAAGVDPQDGALPVLRRELLTHADGRRTVRDLAFRTGRPLYTVTVETGRMLGEGLLDCSEESAPERPPVVRTQLTGPLRPLRPGTPGPEDEAAGRRAADTGAGPSGAGDGAGDGLPEGAGSGDRPAGDGSPSGDSESGDSPSDDSPSDDSPDDASDPDDPPSTGAARSDATESADSHADGTSNGSSPQSGSPPDSSPPAGPVPDAPPSDAPPSDAPPFDATESGTARGDSPPPDVPESGVHEPEVQESGVHEPGKASPDREAPGPDPEQDDDTPAGDAYRGDAPAEDAYPEDPHAQDASPEDAPAGEPSAEDAPPEDARTREASPEGPHAEDAQPEGPSPEDGRPGEAPFEVTWPGATPPGARPDVLNSDAPPFDALSPGWTFDAAPLDVTPFTAPLTPLTPFGGTHDDVPPPGGSPWDVPRTEDPRACTPLPYSPSSDAAWPRPAEADGPGPGRPRPEGFPPYVPLHPTPAPEPAPEALGADSASGPTDRELPRREPGASGITESLDSAQRGASWKGFFRLRNRIWTPDSGT